MLGYYFYRGLRLKNIGVVKQLSPSVLPCFSHSIDSAGSLGQKDHVSRSTIQKVKIGTFPVMSVESPKTMRVDK